MPPKRKLDETNLEAAKRQRIELSDRDVDFKKLWSMKCQKLSQQHFLQNYEPKQRAYLEDITPTVLALVFQHGVKEKDRYSWVPEQVKRNLISRYVDKAMVIDQEYEQWNRDIDDKLQEFARKRNAGDINSGEDEDFLEELEALKEGRYEIWTQSYLPIGYDREAAKANLFNVWRSLISKRVNFAL
jgi:hypothetical protein